MNKKIYDILPPKEIVKETNKETEKEIENFSFKKRKKEIIISSILIFIFLFCYFTLPKAEIEIWPKTEILSFETNKIVLGEIREKETTVSQEFSSSGKVLKEKKSEGVIRVYNTYSTSSRALIPSRFISDEGKLFWSTKKIRIPGAKYEKGKLVPGEIDVEVVAAEPGEDYNISPSSFALPALAGSSLYTTIYGKSFKSMEGGMKEEVIQVSQEDLEQAKKTVKEKAIQDCKTALKNDVSSEFILLDSALETKIIKTSSSAEPEQEKEKFSVQAKAISTALVFKRKDIEDFSKMFILSQISEDKKFYQESLEISYSSEVVNLESGKMSFDLKLQGKIYSALKQTNLKKALTEKSLSEVNLFLENQDQITKADVYFWPFWVKKVPKNTEKIEIELKFD